MQVAEYGAGNRQVIILLHGGGLAPWNYCEEANALKGQFHVIVPVLDGHSGSDRDFSTIEENARALIQYIDTRFEGRVLLIGGLSLGGQILIEMLSQRKNICKFAMVESALVLPRPVTALLIKPVFALCYPLIKMRWFAKLQFYALRIKPSLFEDYFKDSIAVTKGNMIAFLMANATYKIKSGLSACQAQTLVLVGSKERRMMKKSAEEIAGQVKKATLETLPGYYHGDLSINHADAYIKKLLHLVGDA